MMCTLLRTPKMYCAIFGFQRRVLCPKCTPASKSWRMVKVGSAMAVPFPVGPPRALVRPWAWTPERPAGMSPRPTANPRADLAGVHIPGWHRIGKGEGRPGDGPLQISAGMWKVKDEPHVQRGRPLDGPPPAPGPRPPGRRGCAVLPVGESATASKTKLRIGQQK